MIEYVREKEVIATEGEKTGYNLIDERHGAVNGAKCGVSFYTRTEFHEGAAHEEQEGFYVLEGKGYARIDGDVITMEPGTSFIIPAHVNHSMIRDKDSEYCKVFWFHAAAK